jgi:SHS2 domain-containing protein
MYETFEHTADMGLRVRAANVEELFTDAGRALSSVMVANLDAVRAVEEIAIHLEADHLEDLWHDWLSELLYTFHGRRLALAEFQVTLRLPATGEALPADAAKILAASPIALDAAVRGEPIDPKRHEVELEVKAVTWHHLKVEPLPGGWLGEVILDL